MIAATGHTKNTPTNTSGMTARTTRHTRVTAARSASTRRATHCGCADLGRGHRVRVGRRDREPAEHFGERRALDDRIDVHLERYVLLEAPGQHEVDQRAGAGRILRVRQHPCELR